MKTLLLLPIILSGIQVTGQNPVIEVELSNVKANRGAVLLSLYTAENQYPYNPEKTYTVAKDSLKEGFLHYRITDLAPGTYGMCVLDDENRDGKMEYNLIGLPAEGYGFANNVKPLFRRPDYQRVLFTVRPGRNKLEITLRYR